MRPDAVRTDLTSMFNIDYPIIGAPMFLVSSVRLAAATTLAGGLGTFPALNFRPVEKFREAVREMKKKTNDGAFGVNIIVQKSNKHQQDHLEICLEEGVPLIISSLGSPREIIKRCVGTKTRIFCDVIGLEHAKKVEDLGADGLIAVGAGAGGHAGEISPFALIPHLKAHSKLPVIAAGSIVDGRGMIAALGLGASGVYMGTRMIATLEAEVEPAYKQAILDAQPESIVNTDRVDGFPGNFIKTESLLQLGLEKSLPEVLLSRNAKIRRWISLARAGRALFSSHGKKSSKASYKTVFSAGHGAGLIEQVESVEDVLWETVRQYRTIRTELPK